MRNRVLALGLAACALALPAGAGPGELVVIAGPWVVSEHEAPGAINQFPVAAFNPAIGKYVCAYESNAAGGVFQIRSRRLQKDGSPDAPGETLAADGGNFQGAAAICFNPTSDRFTVTFREFLDVGGGPTSEWALSAQLDGEGTPLNGAPTLVGEMAYEMQLQPNFSSGGPCSSGGMPGSSSSAAWSRRR